MLSNIISSVSQVSSYSDKGVEEPLDTHQSCMSCCPEFQMEDPFLPWLSWSE